MELHGDWRRFESDEAVQLWAATVVALLNGLEPAAVQTRNSLAYVDASPHGAAKNCTNCQFYEAAPSAGQCGGCTIVPGPIHPEGYCNSWAAKQA